MTLVLTDRTREITTTTGTGTVVLGGAVYGFQSFAGIGNGNTTFYGIVGRDTSEWEIGVGTYASAGTTLARTTVLSSSAGGTTHVTFSAGTKDVFCTNPAAMELVLPNARAIYGNSFDGSADLTQVILSTYGGTSNGFTKFMGPTTTEKAFTLPNANATLLYDGGSLGTPSAGSLANCTGLPYSGLAANVVGTGAAFSVTRASQSASNNTDTTVLFNSFVFDTNTFYTASTGKFQPTIPGFYQFNTSLSLVASGISLASCQIRLNNSAVATHTIGVTYNAQPYLSNSALIQLNGSSDYVTVVGYITGSSGWLVGGSFSGFLVRGV